jgi:hypothetical protein
MLAYLLWHQPDPAQAQEEYLGSLQRFHRSLADNPPGGFRESWSHEVPQLPWTPGKGFEDWYLIDDFPALGALNEAAVTGARKAPHEDIARRAGGGAGGLYRLRLGELNPNVSKYALWFGKPAGESYAELVDRLAPLAAQGACLWGRELVFGPAPEFCLQVERDSLIEGLNGFPVPLTRR